MRTRLWCFLAATGLGIVFGYIAASGQLDSLTKLWAEGETRADRGPQQAAAAWPKLCATRTRQCQS